jgi:hypothetical protein
MVSVEEWINEAGADSSRRTRRLRNVLERLPKEQGAQTKSVMNAAFKLEANTGVESFANKRSASESTRSMRQPRCSKASTNVRFQPAGAAARSGAA